MSEERLREKLRKIEALYAGATTAGVPSAPACDCPPEAAPAPAPAPEPEPEPEPEVAAEAPVCAHASSDGDCSRASEFRSDDAMARVRGTEPSPDLASG